MSTQRRISRLAKTGLLPSLLLLEVLLVLSLRSMGWNATVFSVQWIVAALAAILPLAIAVWLLFCLGRRVRLKTLAVAFVFIAISLAFSVSPLLQHSHRRRASSRLRNAGVEIYVEDRLVDFDAPQSPAPFVPRSPRVAAWLIPLLGHSADVCEDVDIKCVTLANDHHIEQLCAVLPRLPSLRHVVLDGPAITDEGLGMIVNEASQVPALTIGQTSITRRGLLELSRCDRLEHLTLCNSELPEDLFRALPTSTVSLFVWAEGPNADRCRLKTMHVRDIGSMHKLETLMIQGYNTTNADILVLTRLRALRHLVFHNTLVTRRGLEPLTSHSPSCRTVSSRYAPSEDTLDQQFALSPQATVMDAFGMIERRCMALLGIESADFRRPLAIWRHPDLGRLFRDLASDGYLTADDVDGLNTVRQLQIRSAPNDFFLGRTAKVPPDWTRWVTVVKPIFAGLDRAIEDGFSLGVDGDG